MTDTIDFTPTWVSLLEIILLRFSELAIDFSKGKPVEEDIKIITIQFTRMALAADRWNAHIKSLDAGKGI